MKRFQNDAFSKASTFENISEIPRFHWRFSVDAAFCQHTRQVFVLKISILAFDLWFFQGLKDEISVFKQDLPKISSQLPSYWVCETFILRIINDSFNRPFYSCVLSGLVLNWKRGWGWPCFDTDLTAFHMLMQIVSIRTVWSTYEKRWGLYQNKVTPSLA